MGSLSSKHYFGELKLKQEGGDMGDGELPTGIEDVSDVSESDDAEEDYIPQVYMAFSFWKNSFS